MERFWGLLTTIRFRLGAALTLALLPVLLLGAIQASLAFRKDSDEERTNLALAAGRSAATAHARMEGAVVLLQALAPQTAGAECGARLAQMSRELGGYQNLIRFDAAGHVLCAANPAAANAAGDWFALLKAGQAQIAVRAPDALGLGQPALLEAKRAVTPDGRFDGALAAVMTLDSLRPAAFDPVLPTDSQVGLLDSEGHFLVGGDARSFPAVPGAGLAKAAAQGSAIQTGRDLNGAERLYAFAPLQGDVFVVLSAPPEGWFSWTKLNPLSGLLIPLLAFLTAIIAVMVVTERVVVRWLHYLQRIADIYAKGRFTVRPLQADRAPPEIRQFGHALDSMAEAIVARDASLHATLAEKDALMREIHHRVRNNLQVISSLLSMQQRALTDPAAREAMFDTRQRINALALIYRALYQGADLKRVDIRQFLADLVAQLIVEQQEHGELVQTDVRADELIIDPDKLAPLALFAVEAISNAQKHALSRKGGVLRVTFCVDGDEAELAIIDEGSGAEPELARAGVGRALMTAFARQLRGRMELSVNPHGGVTARLLFPTPQAANETPQAALKAKPRAGRAAA